MWISGTGRGVRTFFQSLGIQVPKPKKHADASYMGLQKVLTFCAIYVTIR